MAWLTFLFLGGRFYVGSGQKSRRLIKVNQRNALLVAGYAGKGQSVRFIRSSPSRVGGVVLPLRHE